MRIGEHILPQMEAEHNDSRGARVGDIPEFSRRRPDHHATTYLGLDPPRWRRRRYSRSEICRLLLHRLPRTRHSKDPPLQAEIRVAPPPHADVPTKYTCLLSQGKSPNLLWLQRSRKRLGKMKLSSEAGWASSLLLGASLENIAEVL